jgi:replicative DNA helicase
MAEPLRLVAAADPARELPANVEAEAALLGALMIDNRLVADVQMQLRADHFFEDIHGRIYTAILTMTDRNMIANPVTLRPLFETDAAMKELGGPAYLAKLAGSGAALIGARDFAQQIYDLALLRELVTVGRDMVEGALDTSEEIDPQGRIESAEMALYKVAEAGGERGGTKSFAEATKVALEMAEKAQNSGGGLSGITTGLDGINARTGGLHHSDLVILAGRPGMGKTALATNIAFNTARRFLRDMEDGIAPEKSAGARVAFFSLEMSADQLATRILAEQSGISSEALRMGKISTTDFRNLARAAAELQTLPLYIDDTPGLTIAALRTRARRMKRQHKVGFIVVDYLQLLQGSGARAGDNRVQEISEISRGLKTLAKELEVPVLALSQLSRAVEQREDKKPQLSDLRESGSIEQDADMVWFVFREEYYVAQQEPRDPDDPKYPEWMARAEKVHNLAECIIAKQRHGATGKVRLKFEANITRFSDLADEAFYGDAH